ncbi:hypothetical protein RW64_09360 [Geobacter sulfurreducens]|nr:hypothetical protein RW64_09360 [Geobacter sulfurreducens]
MKNKGTTMDDRNFKAANTLRAVYEQRACPPDDVLFAVERSEELMAHLGYCRYCNERLEMTADDRSAWEELSRRLKQQLSENRPELAPAPGQVWSLDRKRLGGWGPYDRYYNPPLVLVLQLQDNGQTIRVAQICAEEDLKGDDGADVWLDDSIGFAESWNVYSVHRGDLNVCRGEVDETPVFQVLAQPHSPSPANDIHPLIRSFRELEVQVGAFVAMRAMPQVMAAVESPEVCDIVPEKVDELIPGLTLAVSGARDFVLEIAAETFELLRGTFKPAMVLRGDAMQSHVAGLSNDQKKLVEELCPVIPVEVKVVGGELKVTLKWLHGKPDNTLLVRLSVNSIEMPVLEKIARGNNLLVITTRNHLIDKITGLKLRTMKLVECAGIVMISLHWEMF